MVGLMIFLGLVCACCGGYGLYVQFDMGLSAEEIDWVVADHKLSKMFGTTSSVSENISYFFLEHCYTFLIAAAVLIIAAVVIKKLRDMFQGSAFQEYLEYQKSKHFKDFYDYQESKHNGSSSSMLSNALKQKEADEADKGTARRNTFAEDYWVCGKCKSRIPNKLTVCKYCGHSKW